MKCLATEDRICRTTHTSPKAMCYSYLWIMKTTTNELCLAFVSLVCNLKLAYTLYFHTGLSLKYIYIYI